MFARGIALSVTVLALASGGLTAGASAPAGPDADFQLIDDFAYGPDEARKLWEPMAGSAPAAVGEIDGRRALRLPCRFEPGRIERASWDRKVQLDMTACKGVQFLFRCKDPAPIGHFTMYLRSGGGWYRGGFHPAAADGWVRVRIARTGMGIEGGVGGWGGVDTIRLSAWRSGAADTEFQIAELGLYGGGGPIVVVRGEAAAAQRPEEARGVETYTEVVVGFLDRAAVPHAVLSDRDLTPERLTGRKLVILPYNPYLPQEAAGALAGFVRAGGKLLACYTLPGELQELVGIRGGAHVRQQHTGHFAEIRPSDKPLAGMPAAARQASWNIHDAKPIDGRSRVAAWWHDHQGQPTGKPAVVASDNCVFLTHVLLGDDPAAKQQLLLAMVGGLLPEAWAQAAAGQLARVGELEPYDDYASAAEGIRRQAAGHSGALAALDRAGQLRAEAHALGQAGRHVEAVAQAAEARAALREAHCLAQKPRPGEWRGIWCHSAFGVPGMTWDQAVRTLADNGFTAVLPNMLWGGVAFYDSDVLPVAPEVKESGDQIAQCLAACRRHGVECHVWKVNWNMGWRTPKEFAERMKAAGRTQVKPDGAPSERWLCPSHPDNRKLEIDAMVEVARKYDVHGVHFDYIRYPGHEGCYCPGCRERFEKATGRRLARWPADVGMDGPLRGPWLDFRREQVTAVVAAVAEQARKVRPGVRISAAVFRDWPADRDAVGQDWKLWCDRGYLDLVCPMDYTPDSRHFESMVSRQLPWAGKVPCCPGIGVSTWTDPADVAKVIEQVRTARRLGAAGFTIFDYSPGVAREVLPMLGKGLTRSERAGRPPR